MLNKIILWTIFIAPWFSLFFLKKEHIKYYMPAGIFATLLMLIYNVFAFNHKHWELQVTILPALKPLFASGVLGAFPVLTIWIFHFTYGRLLVYFFTNVILDFMFAIFPGNYLFEDVLGIYELINITSWERWIIFVIFSIIIYGYFKWQESIFDEKKLY